MPYWGLFIGVIKPFSVLQHKRLEAENLLPL
jgi:hypothetical protein